MIFLGFCRTDGDVCGFDGKKCNSFVLVYHASASCFVLRIHYRGSFMMSLPNDKEFHMKGSAVSEIDLHATSSEYEKSKLIMKESGCISTAS